MQSVWALIAGELPLGGLAFFAALGSMGHATGCYVVSLLSQ